MSNEVRLTNAYRFRRELAMNRLVALRASSPDVTHFGLYAAALIDKLLAEESGGKPAQGAWTDDERAVLREVFGDAADSSSAATMAERRLYRTRSQIMAMAGNMRLKR